MIPLILDAYAKNLALARLLAANVPEARRCEQPTAGGPIKNHAAWVIGHLAHSSDFLCTLLGAPREQRADFGSIFGMSSSPSLDCGRYPPLTELTAWLSTAHARAAEALGALPLDRLADPVQNPALRDWAPTLGNAVLYLTTNHEATHLGQLSAWRRAIGLGPVSAPNVE